MSSNQITFDKQNLDLYLKEVAREFRKMNGKQTMAEIILVGGASILANYGFREMTSDMDAIIRTSSPMKDVINRVGDKYNLPNGWLNSDFVNTDSYSEQLIGVSKYYRTYSNIVEIRTVRAEYLIAMKLISARKYKSDFSDIIGILKEHQKINDPISFERISQAVILLYGSWDKVTDDAKIYIQEVMKKEFDYDEYYTRIRKEEMEANEILVDLKKNILES